jgi:hypothetical protein
MVFFVDHHAERSFLVDDDRAISTSVYLPSAREVRIHQSQPFELREARGVDDSEPLDGVVRLAECLKYDVDHALEVGIARVRREYAPLHVPGQAGTGGDGYII